MRVCGCGCVCVWGGGSQSHATCKAWPGRGMGRDGLPASCAVAHDSTLQRIIRRVASGAQEGPGVWFWWRVLGRGRLMQVPARKQEGQVPGWLGRCGSVLRVCVAGLPPDAPSGEGACAVLPGG